MNYKMVDARPVVEQFNKILHILSQFSQHNMKMDEKKKKGAYYYCGRLGHL
jgi:hypothetical protein